MRTRKKLGRSKTLKPFEFFDETYLFQWVRIVGGTQNEAIDYLAKQLHVDPWKSDTEGQAIGHFAAYKPFKSGLIWFRDKESLIENVTHECFHGTMYLFECLGLEGPTKETEEVFAYYLQWLTNKISKDFLD